jgi:ADP-ribose pyrophosphatase YjhB (NUDIX family)
MTEAAKEPRIRVAGIVVREGRVLLAKHAKDGRSYYLLPGGGVEWGESLHAALVREFKEEVCIEVAPGPLALAAESIAPDASRHIVHLCFQAEWLSGTPRLGEDPRIVAVEWIDVRDLSEIPMFPDIRGPLQKTILSGFKPHLEVLRNPWKP